MCRIKLKRQKNYISVIYMPKETGVMLRDFVYAMWLILQQKKPDDYVVSTGNQTTVKNFVNMTGQET